MSAPYTFWCGQTSSSILIDVQAAIDLERHRQTDVHANEAGGILIGERRGAHIWVRSISFPQPDDWATKYSFFRRSKAHQQAADSAWQSSGGAHQYVGEWHSHPESMPRPSLIDRASWMARSIQTK